MKKMVLMVMATVLAISTVSVGCRRHKTTQDPQPPTERDAGVPDPDPDNDMDPETQEAVQRNLGG